MLRIITILIILLLVLTGCKFTQADYTKLYQQKEQQAIKECHNKRMDVINVYSEDLETWTATCVTKSPCKIYRFEV